MAAVSELIRSEANGSISFGDYTLTKKTKLDNYEYEGDIYKVKTFREITKLEKNELLVYESVPGTAVENFKETADSLTFLAEGPQDAEVTLGLAASQEYEVDVDGRKIGTMKTNAGGKLTVSLELSGASNVKVTVTRK